MFNIVCEYLFVFSYIRFVRNECSTGLTMWITKTKSDYYWIRLASAILLLLCFVQTTSGSFNSYFHSYFVYTLPPPEDVIATGSWNRVFRTNFDYKDRYAYQDITFYYRYSVLVKCSFINTK